MKQLSRYIIMICLSWVLIMPNIGKSEIYKYKDENGDWHYTDAPVALPDKVETIESKSSSEETDLAKVLQTQINPRNGIERANIATVAIKTSLGHGSGFFITDNGYIITNKHVVRGDEAQIQEIRDKIEYNEEQLREMQESLEQEEAMIEKRKQYLRDYPDKTDSRYQYEVERLERVEQEHYRRKAEFQAYARGFASKKYEFNSKASSLRYDRRFKIILMNKAEYYAYLITTSKKYDLALLKLDGYVTPFLTPKNPGSVRYGQSVYALGNPINPEHSVTSGVLSGFHDIYVKTNAQVYPGNSGGPLVTADGDIIGINTMKEITYKFEGLGYAIKIGVALKEFKDFLK